AEHGILTQAWSPIGGTTSFGEAERRSFGDPVPLETAAAHEASAAPVILAWHPQQGRQEITKSVRPERIPEEFAALAPELTAAALERIDGLETGVRGGPEPSAITLENFGRPIPEA